MFVDLHDVKIDPSKSVVDKMNDYFEQIKNPYLFKVGDVRVKVSFGGDYCFGIAANMDFLLVCTYEENGENPELVIYKKR